MHNSLLKKWARPLLYPPTLGLLKNASLADLGCPTLASRSGSVVQQPENDSPAARNDRGFTLIEMLVVLMIMGLFLGLVSAITRPDDRAVLRLEAERLSQLLEFAATEAQLTGKAIAWIADASGYRFWRLGEDYVWSEIRDSELLRARTLPQGMAISAFRVENMQPQGPMRLEFAPQGASLAFTIGMSLGTERYAVAGSPTGDVRLVPGNGIINGDVALR
jgi:general secretion pathway protein H